MTGNPQNQILITLSRALNRGKICDRDPIEVAELVETGLGSGSAEEWENIFSLDCESRTALMALREYPHQDQAEQVEIHEEQREAFVLMAKARWIGSLRIDYTLQSVFRVTQWTGELHLSPWMGKLYRIAKQMLDSEHTGLWPSQRVEFSWPDDKPVFQSSVRIRQGVPVLTIRRDELQWDLEPDNPIEIDYWRGERWVGSRPLCLDDPETEIHLKPGWPYLFCARTAQPCVLKITCGEEEFSPTELRMGIVLRVLMGDISGGFGLLRQLLALSTPSFRSFLAVLSRCLPGQSLEAGYAPVRDALAEEEIGDGIKDLFKALAWGWLSKSDPRLDHPDLSQVLLEMNDPLAQGFLLAIQGQYEEALDSWFRSRNEEALEAHVAGACYLAFHMVFPDKTERIEVPSFADKDLDTTIQSLVALRECQVSGMGDLIQLARRLSVACQ